MRARPRFDAEARLKRRTVLSRKEGPIGGVLRTQSAEGSPVSIIGESPLDQERATVAAIQRLRRRAEQFRQLAAMAVTKKAAAILLETSRGYAEQAAYWEAKLITSRPVL